MCKKKIGRNVANDPALATGRIQALSTRVGISRPTPGKKTPIENENKPEKFFRINKSAKKQT